MRSFRLVPILAVLLASAPASAQVSIWLQRGVSGFGGNIGLSRGDEVTTFGVGGGYSYQGWIDFDLTYNYSVFDEETALGALDIVQHSLVPSVQWHPLKQSKTIPVSIGLGVGVPIGVLDSENFVGEEGGTAYGLAASASVYRFFRLSSNVGIIPAAAFTVNYTKIKLTDENGDEIPLVDDDDTSASVSLGAYIAYLDSGGRIWGVVPQISFGDETVFGISVGIIFSQVPPEPPPPYTPPPPPPAQ